MPLLFALYLWTTFSVFGIPGEAGTKQTHSVYLLTSLLVIVIVNAVAIFQSVAKLAHLSQVNHNRKSLPPLNLSEDRWRDLCGLLTEAGLSPKRTVIRLALLDSFGIRAAHIPRLWRRVSVIAVTLQFIGCASRVIKVDHDNEAVIILIGLLALVLFVFSVCAWLIDSRFPRFHLIVNKATLVMLRKNPRLARPIFRHELSHIRHRDPVHRLYWLGYSQLFGALRFFSVVCCFFLLFSFVSGRPLLISLFGTVLGMIGLYGVHLTGKETKRALSDLTLLQEMRADAEASHSGEDHDALLLMLDGIAVESVAERKRAELERLRENGEISFPRYFAALFRSAKSGELDSAEDFQRQREEIGKRAALLRGMDLTAAYGVSEEDREQALGERVILLFIVSLFAICALILFLTAR